MKEVQNTPEKNKKENLRQAAFKYADDEYKRKIQKILRVVLSKELSVVETEEPSRFSLDLMLSSLETDELRRFYEGFYLVRVARNVALIEVTSIKFSDNQNNDSLVLETRQYTDSELKKKYSELCERGNYHFFLPSNYHLAIPLVMEFTKANYLGAVLLEDMEPSISQDERSTALSNRQMEYLLRTARDLGTSFIFTGNNYEYTQTQSHYLKLFKLPLPKQKTLKFLAKAWIEHNDSVLQKLLIFPSGKAEDFVKDEMSEQISPILLGTTIEEAISILGNALSELQEANKGTKCEITEFYNFLSQERKDFLRSKKIEIVEREERKLFGYQELNEHIKTELSIATQLNQFNNGNRVGAVALTLLGAPGTGKTTWAIELGRSLNKPVVFLNIQSMYGSLVGQTERNLKQALNRIKAIENVVVVIDEVDKLFKLRAEGSIGNIQDSIRGMLNNFLTEESSNATVFVFCGNRYTIPSDLTRQGRMLGVYYVPYPNREESWEIFKMHFDKYFSGLSLKANDLYPQTDQIKNLLSDLTGAEIVGFTKQIYSDFIKLKNAVMRRTNDEAFAQKKAIEYITDMELLEQIKSTKVTLVKNSDIVQGLEDDIKQFNILSIRQLETGDAIYDRLEKRVIEKRKQLDFGMSSKEEVKANKRKGKTKDTIPGIYL